MELKKNYWGQLHLLLSISIALNFFTQCGASRGLHQHKKLTLFTSLESAQPDELSSPSDPDYSVGSPFLLPPYGDVMGPSTSPINNPPFCNYPPITPYPPSAITPTPIIPSQSSPPPPPTSTYNSPPFLTPNPPETTPSTPIVNPNPPSTSIPNPPSTSIPYPPSTSIPNPPILKPSPPSYIPSPSSFVPSPPFYVPGPPIFLPPIVYPPPLAPPSPSTGTLPALWCVAKPTVPDPIIQEAMDYACGSGADCDSILPSGSCYQPDTLIAHASFAFNSYWQRTKVAGGTCDFGGTAMLITKDPSFDGCRFNLL
ncbi:uncharacterized protein [Typha latifolia]|uniref:uncharacterized protein n=1 Tax=Typha latifolia TaxID=4733 RepID=UPI003C2F1939